MPTLSSCFLMMEEPPKVLAVCCSACCLLLKIHALFLDWICQLQLPAVRSSYIFIWRVLFPISVPQIDAMINSCLKFCVVKINCLNSSVLLLYFLTFGFSAVPSVHIVLALSAPQKGTITCLVLIDILYIERECLLFFVSATAWERCPLPPFREYMLQYLRVIQPPQRKKTFYLCLCKM